jgi:serine/threonine protein kinase
MQDSSYLYMVMELCRGGELLEVITYVVAWTLLSVDLAWFDRFLKES